MMDRIRISDVTMKQSGKGFHLSFKEKLELSVRPLDGFDEDGNDVLPSGGVVMFPMVNRSDIAYLNVENEYGEYLARSGKRHHNILRRKRLMKAS